MRIDFYECLQRALSLTLSLLGSDLLASFNQIVLVLGSRLGVAS